MRAALALLAALATPVFAELQLGDHAAVQTRFGLAQVQTLTQWSKQLTIGGQPVPATENYRVSIRGAFALQGQDHEWLVIETSHNGNMCPITYVLVKLSAAGIQTTRQFGDCLRGVEDIRIEPGRIVLDIGSPDVNLGHITFAFDGVSFTETGVAASSGPAAGAGADVTRWIGTHPARVFDDAGERARFARIMTPDQQQDLNRRLGPAGPVSRQGDWVFGSGCQAHQCNAERGFWAMRISSGQVVAGIQSQSPASVRLFGSDWAGLPPAAQSFLSAPW